MPKRGSFERRLLIALVLFSLAPTLVLGTIGTILLREAASLQSTPAGWERLGDSGQALLAELEDSEDPAVLAAAEQHRAELRASLQQAQRWGYLNRRILEVLPWFALAFLALLAMLAIRSARGMARELARPIHELVGWSARVARGEPLPPPQSAERGEFGTLRHSFRRMAEEIEASRTRALESAKMRAAVDLARGVAHELKNALTPLDLAVRNLRGQRTHSEVEQASFQVIESESRRLDALARAFAQFGSPPVGPRSLIDLSELLHYLARTHVPKHVEAEIDLDPDLPPVIGYYDPLSRAFANLLLNAVEALGDQPGKIRMLARRKGLGELSVEISDTGPGIPSDALNRLWDPAFTTKPKGTGIGLAMVRHVVVSHAGTIEAHNHPEGGAVFRVELPLDGEDPDVAQISSGPPPRVPGSAASVATDADR